MSTVDPVATILGALDRPVQPRPEFAEALLSRLLEELGGAAPARQPRRLPRWRLRILSGAPPRLRLILISLALLLLLAGVALATYFGLWQLAAGKPVSTKRLSPEERRMFASLASGRPMLRTQPNDPALRKRRADYDLKYSTIKELRIGVSLKA